MDVMPARRSKVALFAAIAILLALIAFGYRFVRGQADRVFVSDTVQVIAMTVRNLLEENPDSTDQHVHNAIVILEKASVIHLWYDRDGRIADPWGTPLSIEFVRQQAAPVTCRSAGPDRAMGTADDVAFTAGG